MRAAPQKESRLEREEELGEVREVIRREEWVRRRARMDHAVPPPPVKDFCEDARSLYRVGLDLTRQRQMSKWGPSKEGRRGGEADRPTRTDGRTDGRRKRS